MGGGAGVWFQGWNRPLRYLAVGAWGLLLLLSSPEWHEEFWRNVLCDPWAVIQEKY